MSWSQDWQQCSYMSSILGSLVRETSSFWVKPGHGLLQGCSLETARARLCQLSPSTLGYSPKRHPTSSSPSENPLEAVAPSHRCNSRKEKNPNEQKVHPGEATPGLEETKAEKGIWMRSVGCKERASLYSISVPALLRPWGVY